MIILWGPITDSPLKAIYEKLKKTKENFVLLNQFDVLDMDIILPEPDLKKDGYIIYKKKKIPLKTIKSIYLRPFSSLQMPGIKEDYNDKTNIHAREFDEKMNTWLQITDALIINKTENMASNSSKPYQTELIRKTGLKVPRSIITTDIDEVKKFHKKYGSIIYKSISGVRSIVSKLTEKKYDRLNNIKWCPTQFQEYLTGKDWRVHVVGNKIFPCRIDTTAETDYRYTSVQGGKTEIFADKIPKNIEQKCFEISKKLKLPVVGIDLRFTNNKEWYCFEANPSPGFTYYQNYTGLPIGEAIVELLIKGKI